MDIPDGVGVDNGGVEVVGGASRLEGIGRDEVNDGTGELKEPDMLSMLNDRTRSDDPRGEQNQNAREERRVLVIWFTAHGIDGGKVDIAGGWEGRQCE